MFWSVIANPFPSSAVDSVFFTQYTKASLTLSTLKDYLLCYFIFIFFCLGCVVGGIFMYYSFVNRVRWLLRQKPQFFPGTCISAIPCSWYYQKGLQV